jgi:DNA repair protein REV1
MVKGRQLTIKIVKKAAITSEPTKAPGSDKCDTYKSTVLGIATNSAQTTGREVVLISRSHGSSPGELRGMGVQMTKLEPLKTSDVLPDGRLR